MKFPSLRLPLLAAAGTVLIAGAANAAPLHTTSAVHEGRNVTVSYHPQSETSLKQTGMGPRNIQRCLWATKVWVERRVTDTSGQVIPAMTRKIGESQAGEGNETGFCNTVAPARTAAFGGDEARLKAFVVAAADVDARGLHAELASIERTTFAS